MQTWVNVEFLNQSENLFGEEFRLDVAHGLFGQIEAREISMKTHRQINQGEPNKEIRANYNMMFKHFILHHIFYTEVWMAPRVQHGDQLLFQMIVT